MCREIEGCAGRPEGDCKEGEKTPRMISRGGNRSAERLRIEVMPPPKRDSPFLIVKESRRLEPVLFTEG